MSEFRGRLFSQRVHRLLEREDVDGSARDYQARTQQGAVGVGVVGIGKVSIGAESLEPELFPARAWCHQRAPAMQLTTADTACERDLSLRSRLSNLCLANTSLCSCNSVLMSLFCFVSPGRLEFSRELQAEKLCP